MAIHDTERQAFIAAEVSKVKGIAYPVHASQLERLFVRRVKLKRLHPNPYDEFCFPDIGPKEEILAKYKADFRKIKYDRGAAAYMDSRVGEPLDVQKIRPGGYMIFDMKTAFCYQNIIGNQTWVEQDEDVSYIWENYYYEDRFINEYMLTIFKRREDGLFEKSEEAHYQKAYNPDIMREKIEAAGLEYVETFGGDMMSEPTPSDERFYIVCKA